MMFEVTSPCSLALGLVRLDDGGPRRTGLLGVTLKHPPVNLAARESPPGLSVTGARADQAYHYAERFLQHHGLPMAAAIEVELAIPRLMGLGSDALLGLSVARGLGLLHNLPAPEMSTAAMARAIALEPQDALEVWGFDHGGLLLVDAEPPAAPSLPAVVRRHTIDHPDAEAWAFVLWVPKVPREISRTFEQDRRRVLLAAAPHLARDTWRILHDELWPARERDDLPSFARALMSIQRANHDALAELGSPHTLTSTERAVLDLMPANGALAWGRTITGLALYGLIRGAGPSIALRKKLSDHVGPEGGTVMAAVTDNAGARHEAHDR